METLTEYYKSLDRAARNNFRDLVIMECGFSAVVFYDRIQGRSETTLLEQEKINSIAGKILEYPIHRKTKVV